MYMLLSDIDLNFFCEIPLKPVATLFIFKPVLYTAGFRHHNVMQFTVGSILAFLFFFEPTVS